MNPYRDCIGWHFEYWPLKKCHDYKTWLYHRWAFTNRFGLREKGTRILGVSLTNFRDPPKHK